MVVGLRDIKLSKFDTIFLKLEFLLADAGCSRNSHGK